MWTTEGSAQQGRTDYTVCITEVKEEKYMLDVCSEELYSFQNKCRSVSSDG